jgi:hypothetical protein
LNKAGLFYPTLGNKTKTGRLATPCSLVTGH